MRIVPSESPVANLANLYREPPAILSTRLVTEAVTRVLTLTTEVTTPLTVTLGAREVLTEFRRITTKPIRGIILTHFHFDHINGLEVFLEDASAKEKLEVQTEDFTGSHK